MKIRRIITKSNEELAILIKRGTELISINIDSIGNIDINSYDSDMDLLEEISRLQLKNQQTKNYTIKNFFDDYELNESHFISDEEE